MRWMHFCQTLQKYCQYCVFLRSTFNGVNKTKWSNVCLKTKNSED